MPLNPIPTWAGPDPSCSVCLPESEEDGDDFDPIKYLEDKTITG